jgi:hypothetical protein
MASIDRSIGGDRAMSRLAMVMSLMPLGGIAVYLAAWL